VHTFVLAWALLQAASAQGVRPGDDPARPSTGVHGGVAATTTASVGPVASDGQTLNPTLRLGARPRLIVARGRWSLFSQWGVSRTLTLCDTCDEGQRAGALRAIDSDDLFTRVAHRLPGDAVVVSLQGDLVAPASRDAFVCNPFYGAVGAGTSASVAAGASGVLVSGSARRAFFAADAVPVGRPGCSRPLDHPVQTLAGSVSPTPWSGGRSAAPNVAWSARASVLWNNPHRLVIDSDRLFTAASVGLSGQRARQADATTIDTLSGPVVVPAGHTPWVAQVPASVRVGWHTSDHLSLTAGLSNALPTLLADPGARIRLLPTTTAMSLTADGHW